MLALEVDASVPDVSGASLSGEGVEVGGHVGSAHSEVPPALGSLARHLAHWIEPPHTMGGLEARLT